MDDLDAFRAAQILIRQRDDPVMYAAGRVDDMIDAGDAKGETAWKAILHAIQELQRTTPREGEGVN